jgi:Holliday junction resolvasome RuvABC endonuclease subunit
MMIPTQPTQLRLLSISPSTRGFGFAVLEGDERLVDWGVRRVSSNKNAQSLAKIKELIGQYQPDVIAVEDCLAKESRRSLRVRKLNKQILALAATCKLKTMPVPQSEVIRTFFPDGNGTKHSVAEAIANRFSDELGFRLPPKRKPWMSEDARMNIFDAVALALTSPLTRNGAENRQ